MTATVKAARKAPAVAVAATRPAAAATRVAAAAPVAARRNSTPRPGGKATKTTTSADQGRRSRIPSHGMTGEHQSRSRERLLLCSTVGFVSTFVPDPDVDVSRFVPDPDADTDVGNNAPRAPGTTAAALRAACVRSRRRGRVG